MAHSQDFSEVVFLLDAPKRCILSTTRLFNVDFPWIWLLGQAQWGCVSYCQAPHCNFDVKHLCASHLLRPYSRWITLLMIYGTSLKFMLLSLIYQEMCTWRDYIKKQTKLCNHFESDRVTYSTLNYFLWDCHVNAWLRPLQTSWITALFNCKLSIPQGLWRYSVPVHPGPLQPVNVNLSPMLI